MDCEAVRWVSKDRGAREADSLRAEGLRIARQALWLALTRFPSYR